MENMRKIINIMEAKELSDKEIQDIISLVPVLSSMKRQDLRTQSEQVVQRLKKLVADSYTTNAYGGKEPKDLPVSTKYDLIVRYLNKDTSHTQGWTIFKKSDYPNARQEPSTSSQPSADEITPVNTPATPGTSAQNAPKMQQEIDKVNKALLDLESLGGFIKDSITPPMSIVSEMSIYKNIIDIMETDDSDDQYMSPDNAPDDSPEELSDHDRRVLENIIKTLEPYEKNKSMLQSLPPELKSKVKIAITEKLPQVRHMLKLGVSNPRWTNYTGAIGSNIATGAWNTAKAIGSGLSDIYTSATNANKYGK